MATIVDFSTELFSKSGTTRFGKVKQFYGLSSTGKKLTRRQPTQQETAVDYLTRSLRRVTKDANAITAFSDEMSRLPQLASMNMPVLAVSLVYIDELTVDNELNPNDYNQVMTALIDDPNLFVGAIEKFLTPDQLDIPEELTESQQLKMKENIFRYVRRVLRFRDEKRLVSDEIDVQRERQLAEQTKSEEEALEEEEFLDQGPDDLLDEDEDIDNDDEEPIDIIIPEPALVMTRMTLPKLATRAAHQEQRQQPSQPTRQTQRQPQRQTQKQTPTPVQRQTPPPAQRQTPPPQQQQQPPQQPPGPRQRSGRALPPPPPPYANLPPPPPGIELPPVSGFVPQLLSPSAKSATLPPPIVGGSPKPTQQPLTAASAAAKPTKPTTTKPTTTNPTPSKPTPSKPTTTKPTTRQPAPTPRRVSLQERLTPLIPIDLKLQPVPTTIPTKLEDAENWFYNSENRLILSPKQINFVGHLVGLASLNKEQLVKNTAAFDPYQKYAEKMFIGLQKVQFGPSNFQRKQQLLKRLQSVLNGDPLELTRQDLTTIVSKIYPNAIHVQVPSVGECYFCAVAENLTNKTSSQVRKDLILYFTNLKRTNSNEFKSQIQFVAQNCEESSLLGSTPKHERSDLIFKMLSVECKEGMKDCTDCIWGNDSLNDIIAHIYKIPVVFVHVYAESADDVGITVQVSTPGNQNIDLGYTGPVIGILASLAHFDALLM